MPAVKFLPISDGPEESQGYRRLGRGPWQSTPFSLGMQRAPSAHRRTHTFHLLKRSRTLRNIIASTELYLAILAPDMHRQITDALNPTAFLINLNRLTKGNYNYTCW